MTKTDKTLTELSEAEYLARYNPEDYNVPLTTVDIAIFAIINGELKAMVIRRENHPSLGALALPGGFIDLQKDLDTEACAHRKLCEKTGLTSPYLEQVASVGNASRDPRGWSITVLYYALVSIDAISAVFQEKVHWLSIDQTAGAPAVVEALAFDHNALLLKAFERLKVKTSYTALPVELMPETFTLTELQTVFEVILGRKLPVKSFRRRVLAAGVLEPTGTSKLSGKRPAQLYRSTGIDRHYQFSRPLVE